MNRQKGVTLIELMIVIAIVAIIGAIAIPAYNGYVREAKFSTAMHNIESIRVFLEDYNLENGRYVLDNAGTDVTSPDLGQMSNILGWSPEGDKGLYTYSFELSNSSYNISVSETNDNSIWVRCENRFSTCCDSDTGNSITSCN